MVCKSTIVFKDDAVVFWNYNILFSIKPRVYFGMLYLDCEFCWVHFFSSEFYWCIVKFLPSTFGFWSEIWQCKSLDDSREVGTLDRLLGLILICELVWIIKLLFFLSLFFFLQTLCHTLIFLYILIWYIGFLICDNAKVYKILEKLG